MEPSGRRGSHVRVPNEERARDLEIARAFGAQVREVRHGREMTQEALAEVAGLHPTFISNLERGYRVPTIITLLKLAHALGVDAGELLQDVGPV